MESVRLWDWTVAGKWFKVVKPIGSEFQFARLESGRVRRFRTQEAAERFARALNKGYKRPSGTRR